MYKFIISFMLIAFLTGAVWAPSAQAADPAPAKEQVIASAGPGNANMPVSGQTLPLYLDEDLASKHANFARFAKTEVQMLNRNHHLSRSRMQIIHQPDGSYLARYHSIDDSSLICKVRRSQSKTVPYVGVLSYKERVFEAVASSPEACRSAEFIPVTVIPNRHIFSYKQGAWQ